MLLGHPQAGPGLTFGVMGNLAVPVTLVTPAEAEEGQRCKLEPVQLVQELIWWWGRFSFASKSWTQLQARLTSDHDQVVEALSAKFPGADGTEIVEVKLHVLQGSVGEELEPLGWLSFSAKSYVTLHYNSLGTVTVANTVNSRGPRRGQPQVPTLAKLGVQEQLDRLLRAARSAKDTHVYRLDQTYKYHERQNEGRDDHPDGPRSRWDSETVLLAVRVDRVSTLVVQVVATAVESSTEVDVVCCSLAGEELLRRRVHPSEDLTLRWLRDRLLEQAGHIASRRIKLVLPDATLADADQDDRKLAQLLPPSDGS